MSPTPKHTPTPWQVSFSLDYWRGGATVIRATQDPKVVICVLTKLPGEKEHAQTIVCAVNSFGAMKEALRDAIEWAQPLAWAENMDDGDCTRRDRVEMWRAALALAEKE